MLMPLSAWALVVEQVSKSFLITRQNSSLFMNVRKRKKSKDGEKVFFSKEKELLLVRKFVHRIKCRKCEIVNGQIFEKAANLGPLCYFLSSLLI